MYRNHQVFLAIFILVLWEQVSRKTENIHWNYMHGGNKRGGATPSVNHVILNIYRRQTRYTH